MREKVKKSKGIMITERLEVTKENIAHAGEIIRSGGLVAFPTETVYGLGADALNAEAVSSVYRAKGRPSDNPMIVHIADCRSLPPLVAADTGAAAALRAALIEAFWPGPITFVFPKSEKVPLATTGGLETVAIRMPSSETARALIRAAGRPIAAPSANISGKPSPTTAADVLEDMDGRIDAVLLGENCKVGIESTVLDLTGSKPTILRPGYITVEMLEAVCHTEVAYDPSLFSSPNDEHFRPKAPGMKYRHYAPKAGVRIVEGSNAALYIEKLKLTEEKNGKKVAVLDYGDDSAGAARKFFSQLRECDRKGIDLILVRALDSDGFGFSVMNRMLKSAGYDVIHA